ncbi:MAG: helix-turn-helix transcriptional regulator [Lachnospira sp.]|nr:helix-turn-helix transcriptional regulator [Lachnospira sp.]
MSVFPERLKYLRSINNISQKKLATELHVSQNAVYNWENGKSEASYTTLEQLARYFNVPCSFLMGWDSSVVPFKSMTVSTPKYKFHIKKKPSLNQIGAFYNETKLLTYFRKLNNNGQAVAIERLNELTQIPSYKNNKL